MREQLHSNPKVDYCLKVMFAVNQFDRCLEIYEGAIDSRDKSIRSLEQEGTFTSMRQGCFAFRLNRIEEQMQTTKRQVEFRLNCVGILLVLLILAIIFNDIKDGKLNIAMLEAFGLLAAICVIKLRRLLRKKSDDSLNYSLKMPTAEFLLWFLLPREGREAAIGDTNETSR